MLSDGEIRNFQNISLRVDSDVFIANVFTKSVEIGEIYAIGAIQKFLVLGSWLAEKNELDLFGLKLHKLKRRQNLMGMEIKVSTVNINPQYTILQKDASGRNVFGGGYVGNILKNFQQVLNVTYNIKELDGYAYGLYLTSNDSWTGLMGDLQRGIADVTGCEISSAKERLQYVDFTQPIQIIGRHLHFKKPERQLNWGAFLQPFSPSIWVSLSFTLPLAASVKYLLYKLSPKNEGRTNFSADFFGVFSALVLQGWSGYFGGPSRRFFIWTIFACYMIVSIAYSAKMVAMRTNETPKIPINSLTDVLNKRDWDFGFVTKALERDIFQFSSPDTMLGKIWKNKIEGKKERTLVSSIDEGLSKTFKGNYVFMAFNFASRQVLHQKFGLENACQIHVLKETFFKHPLSIGLQKHSEIKEIFDYRLMILFETGLLDVGMQHSMIKEAVCEEEAFTKINILDVAPAMLLLSFGMVLALFVLFLEHAWITRKKWVKRILNIYWPKFMTGESNDTQNMNEFKKMILKYENGKFLK
ncbi:Hypothetical predicted protein [Cloeon dipterum]|uniref:Ionotropic glutamate receptor L-glutamate and glycine-binding domain-containing protein n=1 Tax=Cloeon dipterum TaxID=197152 RepID=A0A8S1C529_9INSE|nr:Hypothetical predicted protein [Cloeon dipterum]